MGRRIYIKMGTEWGLFDRETNWRVVGKRYRLGRVGAAFVRRHTVEGTATIQTRFSNTIIIIV
jgi:hypothetical protein